MSNTDLPVLFTEGITDKTILKNAYEKLELKQDMPFFQDCFDASFLGNLLKRQDSGIYSYDKTMIALFDFDEAGYNQWNNLKTFDEIIEENPFKGLCKKHKEKSIYALLLPVPDNELKNQVIKQDNEHYKNKSSLVIEDLFYKICETIDTEYFIKSQASGGGEIVKFQGNKAAFAESTKDFTKDNFKNFKPLIDKIKSLINQSS